MDMQGSAVVCSMVGVNVEASKPIFALPPGFYDMASRLHVLLLNELNELGCILLGLTD